MGLPPKKFPALFRIEGALVLGQSDVLRLAKFCRNFLPIFEAVRVPNKLLALYWHYGQTRRLIPSGSTSNRSLNTIRSTRVQSVFMQNRAGRFLAGCAKLLVRTRRGSNLFPVSLYFCLAPCLALVNPVPRVGALKAQFLLPEAFDLLQ